jgi:hypothetical protein
LVASALNHVFELFQSQKAMEFSDLLSQIHR